MNLLESVTEKALRGEGASVAEALELDKSFTTEELQAAADKVRAALHGDRVDTCSIVNARSGQCSEDCKWCAQSAHFKTGVDVYEILEKDKVRKAASLNSDAGVHRFSLVTSGKKVSAKDIDRFCDYYESVGEENPDLYLCASMGLLDREALDKLRAAGVKRYHCNLETSARFFPTLCSTHTHADKLATIKAAHEAGMEVCCGGIIGMGETMQDRLELAYEAREAGATSIPVNILNPIPGTALENTPLISEEDIERSVALMRLIAPKCVLRFAGGRIRLSKESLQRIMRGGMNGALVGDLLTTVGNTLEEDRKLFEETGFDMSLPEKKQ